MATLKVQVGHIIIGDDGVVLRLDAGFGAIMRADAATLVGRRLLDLTAPQDREVCGNLMRSLRANGRPFRVAKRLLRADGSTVWVDKTVAVADFGDDDARMPPLIVATVVPIVHPERLDDPAHLLGMALFLRESRRAQGLLFGDEVFIGDVAWDVLLAAYIAEAQGEVLTLASLVEETRTAATVVSRWITALEAEALIEREGNGEHYRMTIGAHARFEAYLVNRVYKAPSGEGRG